MQLVTGKKKPLVKRFAHAFRQDVGAWVLMLPSLILFIFFVWQPLVNGLILSLFETKGFDPVRFIGLQNFIDVVQESSFRAAVINTFKYTLWSLVLGFPLPILTAVAEQSIPGRPATWQESLRLMGAGWGSIVIVILVIMLCVYLLNRIFRSKDPK